jgi:F0F1-type ATP synthase membrane subunit b/b'
MTISDRHAERVTEPGDAELLIRRVLDLVNAAPKMPLSATVRLEKDEVVELLEEAVSRLPDELRQARWLLKEREEYLAKVQREADDILAAARERAERIVQRTELVREAQRLSRRILEEAQDEARRLRHEAEDYCDQKLATFEIVLERTMKTVQAGREKLRVTPLPPAQEGEIGAPLAPAVAAPAAAAEVEPETGEVFFDQDMG